MQRRSTPGLFTLALSCALFAHAASANCDRLLDALDRSDKQERIALYDIDSRDQPLTGKPMTVRIGKTMYDGSPAGPGFDEHAVNGVNPILAALRKMQRERQLKCDAVGSDTYRGTAIEKIRFVNPLLPAQYNPMTIWIAKASGLPVYHELHDLGPGGFAWVYGDAVKQPPVKK